MGAKMKGLREEQRIKQPLPIKGRQKGHEKKKKKKCNQGPIYFPPASKLVSSVSKIASLVFSHEEQKDTELSNTFLCSSLYVSEMEGKD